MDRETAALVHLIDNSKLREKLEGNRLTDGTVDWDGAFKASKRWSSGEYSLLRTAFNLWSGSCWKDDGINIRHEILSRLDDDNLRAVLEAFMILRGIDILQLPAGVS